MKKFFSSLCVIIAIEARSQVICGTVNEGGVVTMTAPSGCIFSSVDFASYGTPNGSCGSFTIGACHAANSMSIVSTALIGQNSATVAANNSVFGDPCGGTGKRLYIQATYASTLPLRLTSFSARKISSDNVKLDWTSENERNTSHFAVERSADGGAFNAIGSVNASGTGSHQYSFTNNISGTATVYYYRLKMVDIDGRFVYSNILRITNNGSAIKLSVAPNPASKFITITSDDRQEAYISNAAGQLIKKISLISGSQTVDVSTWEKGVYFIKTETDVMKFVKM
jgi:hypothetical protein